MRLSVPVCSFFLTVVFGTFSLAAADVAYFGVVRSAQYQQTNGPLPALVSTNPFTFHSFAVGSTNGTLTNATLKLSNSALVRNLLPDTNGFSWRYEDFFQTQASMDAAYPVGNALFPVNYTVTMYGTNDGVKSVSLNFFLLGVIPVSYPPVPEITNLAAGLNIDSTRGFTLGWKPLGGNLLSIVQLTILDLSSNVIYMSPLPFSDGALSGSSLGAELPAHLLPAGSLLIGHLTVGNPGTPNTNSYPGAVGVAALVRDTEFRLATRPSPGAPSMQIVPPWGPPWRLHVQGDPDRLYQVEASVDLRSWTNVAGIYSSIGSFDFIDTNSVQVPRRFYRARVGE